VSASANGSDGVAQVRRLTLLLSTPRIAPGLFSRDAWTALANAACVLARDEDESQLYAIQESGIAAGHLGEQEPGVLARLLVERTDDGEVVWIGSADGDPGLTDALAAEVSSREDPPEVEILVGSYDVPGSRLLDLVAVMDRLRSPGGCPWDAEQTHESLVPYAIEETHELVEAIESGDRPHMVEELSDLLLQVVFHARVGQEHPDAPFGIDDVAGGIVEKLVRRHPHVFADVDADTPQEVSDNWEQLKAAEKPHRTSPLDGIPQDLPALARASKAAARLSTAGRFDLAEAAAADDDLGSRLFALVLEARSNGQDPEALLRASVRALDAQL
jgi:NTP pyrophosphatase (non-canonical NTP hydrolase)